ncbi:transposase [Marinobacter nanhaiticus D15-8W]|uniref:Transposase n=1 Tax=Marinobacter nanhaiticus D15-8W TaxID=626887 RepID=N6WWA7_9GAMM|nr:transposase [Marinobacter nanhaiticus]ENO13103.1 transposase [Marinobacter nanhaiticus D15-8W]BES70459.1 transposase [Marinobacter nanhaiticus D15-8W]
MPRARKAQVALEATPYYHCVSRCVRRAFLCGRDHVTGQDFSHRRAWIENRLLKLATVFALEICAYAVMSNHVHVVLHINQAEAEQWSLRTTVERWHQLFKGTLFSQHYLRGEPLRDIEQRKLEEQAETWRARLQDISWFMRCLNEDIARRANLEDGCTGRFWEGRFKSQALLDEQALAACLAYVDLNPVRAGIAKTPEASGFTSVRARVRQHLREAHSQPFGLFPFAGNPRNGMPAGLPFRLEDYLELVDWTGRQLRDDKRGHITEGLPPILERLAIDPQHWLYMSRSFESRFKGLVGTAFSLKTACQQLGYRRTVGLGSCQVLLG